MPKLPNTCLQVNPRGEIIRRKGGKVVPTGGMKNQEEFGFVGWLRIVREDVRRAAGVELEGWTDGRRLARSFFSFELAFHGQEHAALPLALALLSRELPGAVHFELMDCGTSKSSGDDNDRGVFTHWCVLVDVGNAAASLFDHPIAGNVAELSVISKRLTSLLGRKINGKQLKAYQVFVH